MKFYIVAKTISTNTEDEIIGYASNIKIAKQMIVDDFDFCHSDNECKNKNLKNSYLFSFENKENVGKRFKKLIEKRKYLKNRYSFLIFVGESIYKENFKQFDNYYISKTQLDHKLGKNYHSR